MGLSFADFLAEVRTLKSLDPSKIVLGEGGDRHEPG